MKLPFLSFFLVMYLFALANMASAQSHGAFKVFQDRCIAFTETGDAAALQDLKKLPEEFRQSFITRNNARSDTVLWDIQSENYFLATYETQDDFCEVIGVDDEFDKLQDGFLE